MNIFYIGSSGALSLIPFKELLASSHSICAVGVFNPIRLQHKVIALENESLALAAQQHNIPLIDLAQALPTILQQCKSYSIDIILTSCYSKRLPAELINVASIGGFNMHPSLLPEYRGPEPVFWQTKHASKLGVSWHRLAHDFDAGNIVSQQSVPVNEGASYTEITMRLAIAGAALMMKLLAVASDTKFHTTAQNPEAASYYPYPQPQDFVLDINGSAKQAYNFIRATAIFAYPYLCRNNNQSYYLKQALKYDSKNSLKAVEIFADNVHIPFKEGVLVATYTGKIFSYN